MGSILAYDTLVLAKPLIQIDTFVTIGSPLGLPVVMKKIAAELSVKLNETVKLKTPQGIQRKWLNFSDIEDKVAFNYNLSDDYDANSIGILPEDYIVNNDYVINNVNNTHKSYGYLRTPEFSNALHEFLVYDRSRLSKWFNKNYFSIYKRFKQISDITRKKLKSILPGE